MFDISFEDKNYIGNDMESVGLNYARFARLS